MSKRRKVKTAGKKKIQAGAPTSIRESITPGSSREHAEVKPGHESTIPEIVLDETAREDHVVPHSDVE